MTEKQITDFNHCRVYKDNIIDIKGKLLNTINCDLVGNHNVAPAIVHRLREIHVNFYNEVSNAANKALMAVNKEISNI